MAAGRSGVETLKFVGALFLILIGIWLLWSGHYTPLLISLGVLSVLITIAVSRRMHIVDDEAVPLGLRPLRTLRYLVWLVIEIAKCNVDVARRILDPKLPISPTLIEVQTGQKDDVGRVLYANSITLTPGTISVETRGGVIVVHALTAEAAEGLLTGDMDRRVTRLERS